MNRLVLIDGNAILHRAYHALPPLTDPEGNVINAVYGFTSMLLKIFHDLAPTHIAVAFDRPAPTFRKEMFKAYQAHRPKMDDELIPQVERVHEMVRAFGIPIYEMDGYEADDIIGTICEQVHSENKENNIDQTIIVTGDRDILQLVEDDKVFVYMPTKGLSEAKLYGEKETKERMGVTPKQIPDFKALAGDASDNYPGVSGIGPKTAVQLLDTFGSFENLYSRIEKNERDLGDIGEGTLEKLRKDKDNAVMSHQLATIHTDVPVEITLKEISTLNTLQAREALGKLGFKTLLKRLENSDADKEGKTGKKEKKEPPEKKDDADQLSLI